MVTDMKETVIQFGTGNFLRGFFDFFLQTLNEKGLYDGKAVIVSPTDSPAVARLNERNCRYTLVTKGRLGGEKVYERKKIESVSRAVNPYRDFDSFLSLAHSADFRFIVSNTTEAGIVFDGGCRFEDRPASSFPGKLTQLLFERYSAGLPGFVIFACELIDDNAEKLKECVLEYAALWKLGDGFTSWLEAENDFCGTLADRIVTGFSAEDEAKLFEDTGKNDPLLDTAEPFHLWVIAGNHENELPLCRAGLNVIWTDSVTPYKKMKVRILNGAHTCLVFPSLLCGVDCVRESLDDPLLSAYLGACTDGYILPALGESREYRDFADAVLERFANPFIRHLWTSISLNSVSKYKARVLPSVLDCEKNGVRPLPLLFPLSCLIEYYRTHEGDFEAADRIRDRSVEDILSDETLWGESLARFSADVSKGIDIIRTRGIREAVKWSTD